MTKKNKREVEEIEKYPEKDYGELLANWEFPEYTKIERNKWWYISFVILSISMLVYSYFTENPLFGLIIIIFIILYTIMERKDPSEVQILILEDGMIIGEKFIEYKEIKEFYIIYQPPTIKNLYIHYVASLLAVTVSLVYILTSRCCVGSMLIVASGIERAVSTVIES